jgi:nitrite reductase/ring-hydroxylating ferredoxin subunit
VTRVVVAPLSEFPPGERRIVEVGGRQIGVFRVADDFYALRNRCPHQGGPLCLGALAPPVVSTGPDDVRVGEGPMLLACPWHGWEYDLATGQSFMGAAAPGVKAYDVHLVPGPYVAETFPVSVEEDYVVLEA